MEAFTLVRQHRRGHTPHMQRLLELRAQLSGINEKRPNQD
jgi:hypothetical protein